MDNLTILVDVIIIKVLKVIKVMKVQIFRIYELLLHIVYCSLLFKLYRLIF